MIEISVMKESKQIHASNNVTFLTSFTRKKNSCPVKIPTLFVKGVNPFLVILAFAGGKRYIYTKQLGYCNRIRTHNHLVRKRTLNHLTIQAKWPVLLNSWVFVYELSGRRFESRCSHLNFRYAACFEQGVPWHSGKLQSAYSLWTSYVTW